MYFCRLSMSMLRGGAGLKESYDVKAMQDFLHPR